MKTKNGSDVYGDDELAVADILLRVPEIILISDSRRQLDWKVKKKRSAIEQILPSLTICENVPSSLTPLSFSPTELDGNCKRIKVLSKKV